MSSTIRNMILDEFIKQNFNVEEITREVNKQLYTEQSKLESELARHALRIKLSDEELEGFRANFNQIKKLINKVQTSRFGILDVTSDELQQTLGDYVNTEIKFLIQELIENKEEN